MRRSPLAALLVLGLLAGSVPPTAAAPSVRHRWPVQPAQVTRAFEVPLDVYAAGHRGIDLAASAGTPVSATAAGEVAWAGVVARAGWVSLVHADGTRTSLGPLQDIAVRAGQRVSAGTVLGRAAPAAGHDGVHLSARIGGDYVDPMLLFRLVLVPRLVGSGTWEPSQVRPLPHYDPWDGRDRHFGFLPGTTAAAAPGWLSAPNPNHVISVAGLLTHTGSAALPLAYLGFSPDAITELSHAGRHPTGPFEADDPRRDQLPYGAAATMAGVARSAQLLKTQLQAQWARQPGVGVDLVGHSFGGVVVLHYLMALHDPADPTLPPISHAITIAAPLEGADGINAARDPAGIGLLDRAVDVAGMVLGVGTDPATLRDLEVGSPLLRDLAASWVAAQADPFASPLAAGTDVLTIGASRDVVVPEHRSDLPGAEHVTLPGGHSGVTQTEAVLQVARAFLSGREVPASSGGWGRWLSGGVSLAEQVVGRIL